jgi:hypothetical protein
VILERSGRTREELQERLSRITGCQI